MSETLDTFVSRVLRKAREMLERENGWTQGTFARDRGGKFVATFTQAGSAATCWCPYGAVYAASASLGAGAPTAAFALLAEANGNANVAKWNDEPGRTQDEVVALFRKAEVLANGAK